jgi:hypothetical protein
MISAIFLAEPVGLLSALVIAACGLAVFASACRDIARAIRGAA